MLAERKKGYKVSTLSNLAVTKLPGAKNTTERHERFPCKPEVCVFLASETDGHPVPARALSISRSGAGLCTSRPFPTGTPVMIELHDIDRRALRIPGRVAHCDSGAEPFEHHVHCDFVRELTLAELLHFA
jgi:hypothetical protein